MLQKDTFLLAEAKSGFSLAVKYVNFMALTVQIILCSG